MAGIAEQEPAAPGVSSPAQRPAGRPPAIAIGVVAGTVLLGLWVVYEFRAVFGPMLLAGALSYILEPLVAGLVRRRWRREFAVVGVFTMLCVAVLATVALIGWQAADTLSSAESPLRQGLLQLVEQVQAVLGGARGEALRNKAQALLDSDASRSILKFVEDISETLIGGAASALNFLSIVFLLPVYIFYLMLILPQVWQWLLAHIPRADRERTLRVLGEIHDGLAAFLRGRVVVGILKGGFTSLGLALCGTPSAVALGLLNGLLAVLPYVGPMIAFVAAAALTAAGHPQVGHVIGVAAVFVLAEGLEGFLLIPWLLGKQVSLHPLTMLFCVVFWGYALGLFGALVAIPLTLILKIILRAYVLPSVQRLAG